MAEQLLIFIISLFANLFSALSGGGAGLIQLPALIFLGLPFGLALATHKVATIALGLGATARHLKDNKIERDLAFIMLLAGLPGVILGASIILQIPGAIAEKALGVLTICLGKSTYARCGIIVNVTPLEPEWEVVRGIISGACRPLRQIAFCHCRGTK